MSPKPHLHFEPGKTAIKKRGDEQDWEDERIGGGVMTERSGADCREAGMPRWDNERENRSRGFPLSGSLCCGGRGHRLVGWPSRRGKVQAAGLHLSCDLTSPRVAGCAQRQSAEGETGRNRKGAPIPALTPLASGRLSEPSYDGKYCHSRLGLTSSSQASGAALLSVCLWRRAAP